MRGDSTAIIVAVLSGLLALANSIYAARISRRLDEQRHEQTKREQADALVARYRDPLLRAAFDLQSRLYNIVRQDFLGKYHANGTASEKKYAIDNTLYVLAEYLGWVEILRRDVQFLDLGEETKSHDLAMKLETIRDTLRSDRSGLGTTFRIFHGEQRAIGEVMMVPLAANGANERSPRHECVGYADFVAKQADPVFSQWFDRLRCDVEELAVGTARDEGRIRILQHALIDLIRFLDPGGTRFPPTQLQRL
jgi:hypothetical protein